jgi:hypothetical protein
MAEQKIQLRKIRDFGENFNDNFLFIRQNFKPLMKSFFAISSIFMVGLAIFTGINQSRSFSIFRSVFGHRNTSATPEAVFTTEYFLMLFFMVLTFVAMNVVLGAYFKYYVENDGRKPGIDELWVIFRQYFFRILFYSIPFSIVTIIGSVFCLAPGIYCWVLFTPFPLITMIEDRGFTETYERCVELLKENFWLSFGIYIVAYLIYSIGSGIIGGIATVIIGLTAYFSTEDMTSTVSMITSFISIFSYSFYIIYFVSIALNYFSLVEKHDGTGLLHRIDQIGTTNNDVHHTEEQF